MAEQLENLELTDAQLAAVLDIGQEALRVVDARYGTGFPHFREGEHNLPYHNGYHSRAVAVDAVRIGEELGFTMPEFVTADASACAHDIVQLKPRDVMEDESAEWLTEQMRRAAQPGVIAEAGGLAIVGTKVVIEDGKLVGQMATRQEYPSRSAERVGLSVACGDFGRMLTPEGPYQSSKLYQEIKGVRPDEAPSMEDLARFTEGQIALRESYRFPLAIADRILGTHRREVVAHGEEMLRRIQQGDITSWAEVEAFDLEFMRQHTDWAH